MSAAGGEEKILVSVRVRPLNEKEKTRNDRCDWECINNTTIICNAHNLSDKPSFTFDKVFGFECPTKQVYDDGAKEVALCVLSGINSSIFAYGQTSSGKTYTMTGITGFAINDIFLYIDKHKQERKFTLKFSAMEIYNEAVRDLLCEDNNNPLRLLDDPERGTVVEKLKEETITDRNHLQELISICETQRKIGETSLNETSSRSHQILRLTIESSKREVSPESSAILAASVCFVDLAGSERASQTLSAGSRLKEGCHINRSLLTLGTVIRKLSKGKHGHIPYRDSKLTRILQNSLGGNARTAIICTMSPARSHLEQSRNTLLFATCAKEVTTNAQVNMVVSEKALVKQLQRELMRMENELKNLGLGSSSSSAPDEFHALLKQKEELIVKMEEQIQELKWQRDVAQSRVENLLKSAAEEQSSSSSSIDYSRRRSYDSTDFDEPRMLKNFGKSNLYSPDEDGFLLDDTTPRIPEHGLSIKWEEMAQKTTQEPEDVCKEVRCIEENSERVIIQDTLDNIVEKEVESVSDVNEAMESKKEDADSFLEKSLYAEDEAQDELNITKLPEEFQETEQSTKKEDMEQNMSKEQPCVVEYKQNYKTSMSNEDKEAMESEKEDDNVSLNAKLEAQDEVSIDKLVEEVQETEHPVEKQDMQQNLSKDQSCQEDKQHYKSLMADDNEAIIESEKEDDGSSLSAKLEAKNELTIKNSAEATEQTVEKQRRSLQKKDDLEQNLWPMANEIEAMESENKDADSYSKTTDTELSLSAKHEAEVEPTINKLEEAHETKQYVEKEETKPSLSPSKEDMTQVYGGSDEDETTYEALKNKVKEMQKTIEYFMSMHSAEENQSPSFNTISVNTSPGDSLKMMRRSRSCRESLLFTKAVAAAASGRFAFNTSNNASFDLDNIVSTDAQSTKDSDTETSSGSFHEFMAGLKQMAMQHHSRHESDTEAEKKKPERVDDDKDTKAEFERQQSQIIELWGVCNVPLVHRTYFFLLFKGDPSDFVYMEVELRRLSFLKDSPEMVRKQSAKTLAREREWLGKQIPKKFGRKEREEVYKKWGVDLSSKQRSMQVTHKAWTNTRDVDHCKESASLVATLVGFDESNMTPKEMFGLSFSPTTTLNIKPSGWRLSNSFSRISLTGGL
ncbi:ATP binding microtubule motor family protein [Raphanus sativus]|uniref:Kinesin-like protein KIN-7I n=1 Tax=Raphanus sativus TaxID=3726 RepID=A0A9W3D5L7_RAPSA|nr:kinesin-like protein KIN-7I [Raphanus sativus]KAJ4913042.1 ATP binding microtubule motor family protein [Raphanus sativus]